MGKTTANLIFCSWLWTGCAFTSLGEGLEQQSCADQAATFCDELNDIAPTDDDCTRWSCDEAEGVCAIQPTDLDGDGAAQMGCQIAGAAPDCDDGNPARSPGFTEQCDGLDNDCDEITDEDALGFAAQSVVAELGMTPQHFSASVHPQSETAMALFIDDDSDFSNVARIAYFDNPRESAREVATVAMEVDTASQSYSAQGLSIGAVSESRFIAVASLGGGSRQLVPGTFASATPTVFQTSAVGFAGAPGSSPSSSVQLAMSTDATHVLSGFLSRNRSAIDGCGVGPDDTEVRLVGGEVTGATTELGDTFATLGVTDDPSPPGMVALSGTEWVVALADGGSSPGVRLFSAALNASDNAVVNEVGFVSSDAVVGEVAVASGKEGTLLAVVYREDCGNTARVYFAVFDRTPSTGALVLRAKTVMPGSSEQRRPTLARIENPHASWLVVFEDRASRILGVAVDDSGALLGTTRPVATGAAASIRQPSQILASKDGFTVMTVVGTDIVSTPITCESQ